MANLNVITNIETEKDTYEEISFYFSYASSDKILVSQIYNKLVHLSKTKEINGSYRFKYVFPDASDNKTTTIKNCRYFVAFISKNYFDSINWDDQKEELELTLNKNNIIPVFLDDINPKMLSDEQRQAFSLLQLNELPIERLTLLFFGEGVKESGLDESVETIYKGFERIVYPQISEETYCDVFISYAHKNQTSVKPVYTLLEKRFPGCWWRDEERLNHNIEYDIRILNALEKSKCVIAFISKEYIDSSYCVNKELSIADLRGKPIIPVFVDDICVEKIDNYAKVILNPLLSCDPLFYTKGFCSNDAQEVCDNILGHGTLKLSVGLGNKLDWNTPLPHIFNKLILHLNRQQEQKGNYKVTQDISHELFSSLKKIKKNCGDDNDNDDDREQAATNQTDGFTVNENNKERYKHLLPYGWKTHKTHLVDFLNKSKHLFLIGEGGGGKTTTLVETCRWLLAQGEYSVCVPLKVINSENNFEKYLERNVFSGNSQMCHLATTLMKSDKPFYVFLDGLNEMPQDYLGTFFNNLETFLSGHHAVKLIISSRFFDSHTNLGSIEKDFSLFRFQKLDRECVVTYLRACGVLDASKKEDIDDTLYHLLHTPLMLTLYCFSERAKKEYEQDPVVKDRIGLEAKPDTTAKILHNYVQTQLYRAFAENNFNESIYVTMYEYILPSIGLKMVQKNMLSLGRMDYRLCIKTPARDEKNAKYFSEFTDLIDDKRRFNVKYENYREAIDIAQNQLSFVTETEDGYSFTHQVFRDFFAAKFLCLEMDVCKHDMPQDRTILDICAAQYSDDVLSFVADLQKEYEFEPRRDAVTRNWQFKKASATENILAKWKNVEGELAQTAVYNLFNILRLGRNGKLFSCDFPGIDLRACNLNGVKFSEFDKDHKDNPHASSFEGAWIDKKCFLPNGHSAPISAMCISSDNILYTGDVTGKVFRWNLSDLDKPSQSKKVDPIDDGFDVTEEKIIRLALSEKNKSNLLVLTNHSVTEFDVEHREVIKNTIVPPHKYLRDVRDNAGVIEVIYDTAPLTWRSLDDNKTDYLVDDRCPISGCIRKSPCSDVYVYSDMNGQIRTNKHGFYALYQHLFNEIQKSGIEGSDLQDYYEMKKNPSVNDICWHPLGERLLVAYSNTVFEFEYSANNVLKYAAHTAFDSKVTSVGYLSDDRIIVCNDVHINVIKLDDRKIMFDSGYEFSSCYIPRIIKTLQSDNKTYLLSTNKELKILDENLIVKHVRQLKRNVQNVCFARNLRTNEKFLCVMIKSSRDVFCERYDVFRDEYKDLHSNFKVLDDREDHSDKLYTHYRNYKKLISFNRTNFERNEYNNIAGVFIKGCNFKNINNNQMEENMELIKQNMELIKQNGGQVL